MKLRRTRERLEGHAHTGLHEVTHWLYNPAALGRAKEHEVRHGWAHRIHLIPGAWMDRACDRYDRRLGLSETEMLRTGPATPTDQPR